MCFRTKHWPVMTCRAADWQCFVRSSNYDAEDEKQSAKPWHLGASPDLWTKTRCWVPFPTLLLPEWFWRESCADAWLVALAGPATTCLPVLPATVFASEPSRFELPASTTAVRRLNQSITIILIHWKCKLKLTQFKSSVCGFCGILDGLLSASSEEAVDSIVHGSAWEVIVLFWSAVLQSVHWQSCEQKRVCFSIENILKTRPTRVCLS